MPCQYLPRRMLANQVQLRNTHSQVPRKSSVTLVHQHQVAGSSSTVLRQKVYALNALDMRRDMHAENGTDSHWLNSPWQARYKELKKREMKGKPFCWYCFTNYHKDLCVRVRFGITVKFLWRYPSFGIKCQADFKLLQDYLPKQSKNKASKFISFMVEWKFILVYRK